MKFKIGERVLVRPNLKVFDTYNGITVVPGMGKLIGKKAVIFGTYLYHNKIIYIIKDNGFKWSLTEEMLLKINKII